MQQLTRTRVALSLAIAIAFAVGLSACGSSGGSSSSEASSSATTASESTSEASGEEPKIAYLSWLLDTFTQAEVNGAEKTAGGKTTVFNAAADPTNQLKQCEDAVSSGQYNFMILSPVQGAAAVPCVNQAHAAGIPVVAADFPVGRDLSTIEPQVEGVVGSVAYPLEENAELFWEGVELACKGVNPCPVIVEISSLGDPLTSEELKYFEEQAETSPNISVAADYESQYEPPVTLAKLPDLLRANPDTKVIASVFDESAAVAAKVLRDEGLTGKVKIVSNGGSYQGKEMLEKGEIAGIVANYPVTAGEVQGEMVKEYLGSGEVAEPTVDYFKVKEPVQVTKANVSQFEPQWGAK